MELLLNMSIEVSALAFLLLFAFRFFSQERLYHKKSIVYGVLLVVTIVNILLQVFSIYLIHTPYAGDKWFFETVCLVLGITYSLLPFLYFIYLITFMGWNKNWNCFIHILVLGPILFNILLLFSNPITNFLYTFDEQNHLLWQSGIRLFLLLCESYMLFCVILLNLNRDKLEKNHFWALFCNTILFFFSIQIQYFTDIAVYSSLGNAIAIGTLFLWLQNPNDYIDEISGLNNRAAFLMKIDQLILKKVEATIIIVDLNNFKLINNFLGLNGGDKLIRCISKYLTSVAQNSEIYRITGDQFALIEEENVPFVIEQIQSRFKENWCILGNDLKVPASLCKIPLTPNVISKEMVMVMIESAIGSVKKLGKGSYVDINEIEIEKIQRRTRIERALRDSIQYDTLCVFFQPIFSVKENRVTSAEALLRLEDPELGFVSPDEFVEIAEQCGMINVLGEIVIRKTCEFIQNYDLKKLGITKIDINLSTVQCMQTNLVYKIKEILRSYHIDGTLINFEITESAAIRSEPQLLTLMNELVTWGVSFSMDDYGKGYSNSDTILRFPFDMIKLDKEMLWNSFQDERAFVIYRNTVNMIKELKLKILAEGAETVEQVGVLKEIGIDFIQGFYYSKPLPEKKFIDLISSWKN